MSLYESLDVFVGAGILACAEGLGCALPPGAVAQGARFSALLRQRGEAEPVGFVLDALARDIWLNQDAKGIPHTIAEEHARKIVAVLDTYRPSAAQVAAALSRTGNGARQPSAQGDEGWRRLAAGIIAQAQAAGAFEKSGLWDELASSLVEDLFRYLCADARLLPMLLPAIEAFRSDLGASPSFPAAAPQSAAIAPVGNVADTPRSPSPAHAAEPLPAGGQTSETMHAARDARWLLPATPREPAIAAPLAGLRLSARTGPQAAPHLPPAPCGVEATLAPLASRREAPLQAPRPQDAAVAALKARFQLSDAVLARFLSVVERHAVRYDQQLARLGDMAGWLKATTEQLLRPSNDAPEVRSLKTQAAAALAQGAFETAVDLLKRVRRQVREGRRRTEQRLAEEMQSLREQLVEEAIATAGLAELALARFEYDAAAELFAEAADSLPAGDEVGTLHYTMRQAEALFRKGDEQDDPDSLAVCETVWREATDLVRASDDARAAAVSEYGAGRAALRRGALTGEVAVLRHAALSFRGALAGLDREAEPRLWSHIHAHLAEALVGVADHGEDADALSEAIAAFKAAMAALTPEAAPLDWALAQDSLGRALLKQALREDDRHCLEAAADAFDAALTVLSKDEAPVAWAMTQHDLGRARLALAERVGNAAHAEAAAQAFKCALDVLTQDGNRQEFAQARLGLADALARLGEREGVSTDDLEAAVAAYEEELASLSRDRAPLEWAVTQMNLGTALIRLGEKSDRGRHWLAAAAALMPALDVFEKEGAADYANLARRNLGRFREHWDSLLKPARE